jgi:cytochrome c peroxidase
MRVLLVCISVVACGRAHDDTVVTHAAPDPGRGVGAAARSHDERVPASRTAFYAQTFTRRPEVDELVAIGDAMFRDRSPSASGQLACASCHDPAHAFAPNNNDRPVQLGGVDGKAAGMRAAPSLRYLQGVPRFTEHFHDSDGDDGIDQGPAGGLTWDGRAQSAHEQATLPLFSPLEMALPSPEDLRMRLAAAPYAARMRAAFGDDVLANATSALKAVTFALEVYQQDPPRFYPYDSKYDAVLRGRAQLTPREAHGRQLFDDPEKGNCASCHPDTIREGAFPAFSDFGYVALGAPRNRALPANANPAYFDVGLCGPLRADLATRTELCGKFRTPSLRNVTRRLRFFHNGVFTSLEQVLAFYATRDTDPARWYGRGAAFDDLPARYHDNIERRPPFGGKPGDPPRLTAGEIADVTVFLKTLEDGYGH